MEKANRILSQTIDEAKNIVITIKKYNVILCLFHSLYGIVTFIFLAGSISAIFMTKHTMAIVASVFGVLFWIGAWLNANDNLKKHIYTTVLLEFIKNKCPGIQSPVYAVFHPSLDYIECIKSSGAINRYMVEYIMEKRSLYTVRIHTKPQV